MARGRNRAHEEQVTSGAGGPSNDEVGRAEIVRDLRELADRVEAELTSSITWNRTRRRKDPARDAMTGRYRPSQEIVHERWVLEIEPQNRIAPARRVTSPSFPIPEGVPCRRCGKRYTGAYCEACGFTPCSGHIDGEPCPIHPVAR